MPSSRSKPPFDLSSVLIYPNTEEVAFASLGFLKVLNMLATRTILADFCHLPATRDSGIALSRKHLLTGISTHRPVRSFDFVGFSLSYENDFAAIPNLLYAAGIEPLAVEREEVFPFVTFGGFTMASNPLPVADFADAIIMGEAEGILEEVLSVLEKAKQEGWQKKEVLERFRYLDGIFVPAFGEYRVRRRYAPVEDIGFSITTPGRSHFKDMLLVEVGRGCGRGCLFCSAGRLYRPVRFRCTEDLVAAATGSKRIGLVGTAIGDHPGLTHLLETIVNEGKRASLSSLRPDQIEPHLAELLFESGMKSIAIAPETGDDDLRARIGKPIRRQRILDSVAMLAEAGMATIKLYFMMGLPGEQDSHAEAIVDLVDAIGKVRGKARLVVTVSPFVPKPHTPFQWVGFADRYSLRKRLAILRGINKIKGCSLRPVSVNQAWIEASLSRGERWLSRLLLEASQSQHNLRICLEKSGVDPTKELDISKPLPWDFIKNTIPKKRLVKMYERYMSV